MKKAQDTRLQNELSMQNLRDNITATELGIDLAYYLGEKKNPDKIYRQIEDNFQLKKNGKIEIKVPFIDMEEVYKTEAIPARNQIKNVGDVVLKKPEKNKEEVVLISDDDSFIKNIDSDEDWDRFTVEEF